jgi:predicted nucleic acid-binding Zn ribbon protein
VLALSEWLNKIFGRGGSGEKPPSDLGDVIEGVTPHSHCERCGKAITLGKRYCSTVCKRGEGKGPASSLFWIILLIMLMLLLWR